MTTSASARPAKLSAGVVVVNHDHRAYRYLLLRSYRYWDFPKGLVEPGETPIETARREVHEETGLDRLDFRWGEIYIETEPYAGGKIARYYVAAVTTTAVKLGINASLGKPEHHAYQWFAYAEARALLVPRVCAVLDWANGLVETR